MHAGSGTIIETAACLGRGLPRSVIRGGCIENAPGTFTRQKTDLCIDYAGYTNNPNTRAAGTGFFNDVTRGYTRYAIFGSAEYDIIPNLLNATFGNLAFTINRPNYRVRGTELQATARSSADASMGVSRGSLRARIFCDNFTNERGRQFIGSARFVQSVVVTRPLTAGLKLSYTFR